MSNGASRSRLRRARRARSAQTTAAHSLPAIRAQPLRWPRAARRSCSTKVTCAAPRDSASRPSAPLPANRSSTRAPVDARLQPVEQGFPHPVRRRTNLDTGGKSQASAAMAAADDAQDARLRRHARLHHRPRHRHARALRLLPLFFALLTNTECPRCVACHLLGPKRTLRPQYDKFGASFCTARECDRTDSPQTEFRGANS